MTESEWRACEDPGVLLEAARGRATDRQLRLFACACCRSVWGFVPEGPCRDAVEVALRFADGLASAEQLAAARQAAIPAAGRAGPHQAAAWAACETTHPSALRAARAAASEAREQLRRQSREAEAEEARLQADFLRDILGHPTDDVRSGPARRLALHRTAQEIAAEAYAGGPQEDMPALADELERLGCSDPDVLEHCRADAPHVPGCWVLDLLLGHEAGPIPPEEPPAAVGLGRPSWSTGAAGTGLPAKAALAARVRGQPPVVPAWGEPGRTEALRAAFAHHLGPRKYRRALRKAVADPPEAGQVARSPEWEAFVRLRPGLDIRPAEWLQVCTVCLVHDSPLSGRSVRAPREDAARLSDTRFLQARAAHFPNAYPAESPPAGPGQERFVWWCPDCQRERAEWATTAGPPAATEPARRAESVVRLPRGGCVVRVTGPIARGARVMTVALDRKVFAEGRLDDGLSLIALRCSRAAASFYVAAAAGPEGGPGLDPDLPACCEIVDGETSPVGSHPHPDAAGS